MRIETNEDYWDCECETRFIHPKSHEGCKECFALREEQPDSFESELMEPNMASENKGCSASEIGK